MANVFGDGRSQRRRGRRYYLRVRTRVYIPEAIPALFRKTLFSCSEKSRHVRGAHERQLFPAGN
jgi:hypothetical protein